jgi:hypothetical protein
MDDKTRAEAARQLGMKEREITAVEKTADGLVITTHDGVRTLVGTDGGFQVVSTPVVIPEDERCEACGGTGRKSESTDSPSDDGVPDGSADDVVKWVGEDRERAGRALAAEQARPTPRSTLVEKLERLSR